jgi:hypothetical protein
MNDYSTTANISVPAGSSFTGSFTCSYCGRVYEFELESAALCGVPFICACYFYKSPVGGSADDCTNAREEGPLQ